MALPEKRDELNRVDEQTTLNRLHEERGQRTNREIIEEDHLAEDREYGMQRRPEEHYGHKFAMDIHPERYPRESLSRIEEGILDDYELRHADDHLTSDLRDAEVRIDNARNLSRLLAVLGACLLMFAWVLLLWVGWDVRDGKVFFSTMWLISVVIGLGLITWGYVERRRIVGLLARMPRIESRERIERIHTEQHLREGGRAA